MKILIATKNSDKSKEISEKLKSSHITIYNLQDLNDDSVHYESYYTFHENAIDKATFYMKRYNMITIAEDSGLSVKSLYGLPGVYSKRYSGLGDDVNCSKLLYQLEGIENKEAYFTCAVAVSYPDGMIKTYLGTWDGIILNERRGSNGFGYDPIFYDPILKKSAAELSILEKNIYSHRAKAFDMLIKDFKLERE